MQWILAEGLDFFVFQFCFAKVSVSMLFIGYKGLDWFADREFEMVVKHL